MFASSPLPTHVHMTLAPPKVNVCTRRLNQNSVRITLQLQLHMSGRHNTCGGVVFMSALVEMVSECGVSRIKFVQ